ncbi:MAG TPA: energy-coupling factor transporter transmembrane component T [Candidatus Nanoarchaeia archaeon]|nr:energy-coupling factor transporter transmembrane component T [Candidatus Nanoarchaeia archaeon]
MIKMLTFGQYVDKSSIIHNLDARLKLIYVVLLSILVFFIHNLKEIIILSAFITTILSLSRISLNSLIKNLRPFYFASIFILIMYLLFARSQLIFGILAIWRFLMLVLISLIFTFTTKISGIITAIEKLAKPLKAFNIKPRNIATMISIAIRFVPSMFVAMEKTREAMISRLADFKKIKHINRFMVVMLEKMLRSASNLSDAMQARLYNENVENKKIIKFKNYDYVSIMIVLILIAVIY